MPAFWSHSRHIFLARLGPRVYSLVVFPLDLLTGNKVFVSPSRQGISQRRGEWEHLIFYQQNISDSMSHSSAVARAESGNLLSLQQRGTLTGLSSFIAPHGPFGEHPILKF
jgi:hypothetical protein